MHNFFKKSETWQQIGGNLHKFWIFCSRIVLRSNRCKIRELYKGMFGLIQQKTKKYSLAKSPGSTCTQKKSYYDFWSGKFTKKSPSWIRQQPCLSHAVRAARHNRHPAQPPPMVRMYVEPRVGSFLLVKILRTFVGTGEHTDARHFFLRSYFSNKNATTLQERKRKSTFLGSNEIFKYLGTWLNMSGLVWVSLIRSHFFQRRMQQHGKNGRENRHF